MARPVRQRALGPPELGRLAVLYSLLRARLPVRPGDGRAGVPADRAGERAPAPGASVAPDAPHPPPHEMIVVIGAGVGGLAAAAWLAKQGRRVLVLEARDGPGGLASGFSLEGLRFDGGPYVVLDRAGLEWVFHELGEDLSSRLRLLPIEELYDVEREDGPAVRIFGNL